MGTARQHTPEKLVIGILLSDPRLLLPLQEAIERELGRIDFLSPLMPFGFTHYYDEEMGPEIQRAFATLAEPVDPASLAAVKLATNALESRFAVNARRRVNLDPGLLSLSRLVLASTKDSSHRIPIGRGIYAEVALVFEHGEFRPVEWTYPDYASPAYRTLLKEIRSRCAAQLRAWARATTR